MLSTFHVSKLLCSILRRAHRNVLIFDRFEMYMQARPLKKKRPPLPPPQTTKVGARRLDRTGSHWDWGRAKFFARFLRVLGGEAVAPAGASTRGGAGVRAGSIPGSHRGGVVAAALGWSLGNAGKIFLVE